MPTKQFFTICAFLGLIAVGYGYYGILEPQGARVYCGDYATDVLADTIRVADAVNGREEFEQADLETLQAAETRYRIFYTMCMHREGFEG